MLSTADKLPAEKDRKPTFPFNQPAVFNVAAFCAAHDISRAKFYHLLKIGQGPRVMKVGSRTLISHEAAADWRREMEAT